MINTIDMQDMRHLNLFERITRVRTRYCFTYNDTLMFAIPRSKILQALGKENSNLKKISQIVRKRIKVVPMPKGVEDAQRFIQSIINPAEFKEFKTEENEIVITAGSVQNKATLLGRNKKRLEEMKHIVKDFFGLNYRVE